VANIVKDFHYKDDSKNDPENDSVVTFRPLTELEASALLHHSTLSRPLCFQIMRDVWTNTVLVYDWVQKRIGPGLRIACRLVENEDSYSREFVVFLGGGGITGYLLDETLFFFPYFLVDAYLTKITDGKRFAAIRELPPYLAAALEHHGFRINDRLPRKVIEDDSMDTKWAFAASDSGDYYYDRLRHSFTSKYCDITIHRTRFSAKEKPVFEKDLGVPPAHSENYNPYDVLGKVLAIKDNWDHSDD
jgi:hypothetical protein